MNHSQEEYRRKIQAALQAAEICIYEVDIQNQRYTFFENAESIFHKSGEEILEEIASFAKLPPEEYRRSVTEYFSHPDDEEIIQKAFDAVFGGHNYSYEARMKAGDQEFTWCRLHVAPIFENGAPVRMAGVISNIQPTREKMDELENAVYLDTFTRLYTKNRMIELVDMELSENRERVCTMIVIDLDHFKSINDTYGHSTGDEVILSVANHVRGTFRKTDIIARFGGDEFAVLMPDCGREAAERKIAQFLNEKDNSYSVTKSVGIAEKSVHDTCFADLFEKADAALYEAKKTRNTYRIYEESYCGRTFR